MSRPTIARLQALLKRSGIGIPAPNQRGTMTCFSCGGTAETKPEIVHAEDCRYIEAKALGVDLP